MADPDLHPTPYRLALLRDVDAGKVADDADCVPMLDLGDGDSVRVAGAMWEMAQAGWVELAPGKPDEPCAWRLTDAGRKVLEAGAP